MSNVLVTGGSGFVGDAIIKDLYRDKNNNIIGIERDPHGGKPYKILRGDITDFDFVRRVIADEEINEIYHCAANSIVRTCASDPITAYMINVMGTVKLLEAVRTVGMNNIRSIVISTSDKAMGHSPSPYTEESPLRPKYTYESTKSCQDIVAQNYFHNYGLPVKIARCSNIYGPGDPNLSRIIPNTLLRLRNNQKPLLNRGVRDYKREFVYITDVVDAFKMISAKAPAGEIYCVGGTGPVSIQELILKMIRLFHPEQGIDTDWVEYFDRPDVFKEIEEQWIDATKLNNLGWKALVDLDEGLARTKYYYRGII